MILLDTDHLSVLTDRRSSQHAILVSRLQSASDQNIVIPIIAVEEQCRGWLAEINRQRGPVKQVSPYQHFYELLMGLRNIALCPFSRVAADEFLNQRGNGVNIGSNDLKIASMALTEEALLLTANFRDFEKVSGLKLANWLE